MWQVLAYLIITIAEVLVSITALEFSYTQAPKKMKSLVMGLFLASVFFGNFIVAAVNVFIQQEEVVAEGLDETGTYDATVDRTTTFALICEDADGAAEMTTGVALTRPNLAPSEDEAEEADGPAPPTISFTANGEARTIIGVGDTAELAWEVENASSCAVFPPGGEVETSGSRSVELDADRTFRIECEGVGDDAPAAEASVSVVVTDGVSIVSFTAADSEVDEGGTTTLSWQAQRASSCKIVARTVKLDGAAYYSFFAMMMLVTAFLFMIVAYFFKEKTYIQDSEDAEGGSGGDDGSGGELDAATKAEAQEEGVDLR